jgi:excisionase family DNA binding protein
MMPDDTWMEHMDHTGNDRDLMSVADVARELSRSTEQVRRYLREGRLVGRRMGGQWFIERAAVEAFGQPETKEDRFTRKLRPAARIRPLDDVIGIGEGPGSDISAGKQEYRLATLRRR